MSEKAKKEELDINIFYDIYINEFKNINQEKQDILEVFKGKEDNMQKYEDALSDLETKKNEINFDLFESETEHFLNTLKVFNVENIPQNTELVYSSVAYLESIQHDLNEVSQKFLYVKNFWEKYAVKKHNINKDAIFAKDIDKELSEIENEIKEVKLIDLSRLESRIETTKTKVERSVSMISDLNLIIEENFFIGTEAFELKKQIESFEKETYLTSTLSEITEFSRTIKENVDRLKKESELTEKRCRIYKITNKEGKIESFGFKITDSLILNASDIDIEDPIYTKLERFVYIENFPTKGIFKKEFIQEQMQVKDEHIESMKDFERTTNAYFIVLSILGLGTALLSLTGTLSIPITLALTALYPLLFILLFNKTKTKVDKKYNIPNSFHFFQTNYYIVKEGQTLFKSQFMIPLIFLNFQEIFHKGEK